MVKVISWNIARREEAWRSLHGSDADLAVFVYRGDSTSADVGAELFLVQMGGEPVGGVQRRSFVDQPTELGDAAPARGLPV